MWMRNHTKLYRINIIKIMICCSIIILLYRCTVSKQALQSITVWANPISRIVCFCFWVLILFRFFLYLPTFLICSPVENQPFNSKFNDAHKFILNEKSNKSNRLNMIFFMYVPSIVCKINLLNLLYKVTSKQSPST